MAHNSGHWAFSDPIVVGGPTSLDRTRESGRPPRTQSTHPGRTRSDPGFTSVGGDLDLERGFFLRWAKSRCHCQGWGVAPVPGLWEPSSYSPRISGILGIGWGGAGSSGVKAGTLTDNIRPIDAEELLAHAGWMRALARGLVRDDATAEDLVQQAYAVALERPPRDPKALPAWLMRVMRNLAARSFRDESRRERREERVARPEGDDEPLGDLVERAELQRAVMEAVLQLEEPFRSTVLLRYFEERSPEEVARRLGVPVATVGTRLHRALEKLRTRLDREQGGRTAWVAILAPWIGLTMALGVATGSVAALEIGAALESGAAAETGALAGAESSGALAPGAASSATAASTIVAASGQAILGGLVVMQKTLVVSVLAGALCSAIGFGIGRTTSQPQGSAEGQRVISESEYTTLVDDGVAVKERLTTAEAERESLRSERDALTERIARVKADLAAATESAKTIASGETASETASTLVVSFGKWGDLAEIRNANWPELGGAVTAINDMVAPLYEDIAAGRTVSPAVQQLIGVENQKLVRFGVSILEKIPSNAPMSVNGEFTHPISLINLIASMLEGAGLPLSPSQRQELAVIGEGYDREFAALEGGYSESTWELTKVVDELSLKRDTMLAVEEKLTPVQREIVVIPQIQNRIRLDTLSPVNMVVMNVGPVLIESPEVMLEKLVEKWSESFGIEAAAFQENTDLLVRYQQDVADILEPVARETASFVHLDDVVIAGRAQERLFIDLAMRSIFGEELLEGLRAHTRWAVPQVMLATVSSSP